MKIRKACSATLRTVSAAILLWIPFTGFGQANSDNSMPQYYFSKFSEARVRMKNGQVQTQNMNYNIITEKMVFTKGDKFYDLTNPEVVDTITLEKANFVLVGKSFFEVLCSGRLNLYIQHFGSLVPPGKAVGYGGTSQLASADYVSNIKLDGMQYNLKIPSDYSVLSKQTYWIRIGEQWSDFGTEKQFLKLFPDKAEQIKDYMKAQKLKFDRTENMARVVAYINSL
jgi:hypothetical protein